MKEHIWSGRGQTTGLVVGLAFCAMAVGCAADKEARQGPGELERVLGAFDAASEPAEDDIQGNCGQRCPGFLAIVEKICQTDVRTGACDRLCAGSSSLRYPSEARFEAVAELTPNVCGAAEPQDVGVVDAAPMTDAGDGGVFDLGANVTDGGDPCSIYVDLVCECVDPNLCPEALTACQTFLPGNACIACEAAFQPSSCP